MKLPQLTSTKKGAASIYVVVFATILFGVIVLSFMRIILSESGQTNNDDLSQSAYDAAMAGVEDAKIAVNKYYQCKTNSGGENCSAYLTTLFNDQKCEDYPLQQLLFPGTEKGSEVKISESGSDNNTDQAYTCVLLSNKVDDYRSTLSSDTRTRVVPMGIGAEKLANVKYIKFSWYSELNGTSETFDNLDHGGKLNSKGKATVPPTISLSLIKTNETFNLKDFNNSTSANHSTMILLPSNEVKVNDHDTRITEISQGEINSAANSDRSSNSYVVPKSPYLINCAGGEFACSVTLGTDSDQLQFGTGGNAMLVISLPYGDTITDFKVELLRADGTPIPFENVQVSVDSTGRANQLVRRVESRLDPADIFFPYPQYEVQLDGNGDEALKKNFWITANCWTETNPACDNNGDV